MLYRIIDDPLPQSKDKSHHVGSPPSSFQNPWPSFPTSHGGLGTILKTRLFDKRPPFIPIPADRAGLVQVQTPHFVLPQDFTGLKVTWIGHASFLIQCFTATGGSTQSYNILLDPVFSERTSPVTFFGPKRYTPTPCSLVEFLQQVSVDAVCISHNHYDHADTSTLKTIYENGAHQGKEVLFCVALGNPRWLTNIGIPSSQIWEGDWWERIEVPLAVMARESVDASTPALETKPGDEAGSSSNSIENSSLHGLGIRITCTPSQHASQRGAFDKNQDLWCSWCVELISHSTNPLEEAHSNNQKSTAQAIVKSLFFAGDTGYRTVPESHPDSAVNIEKLSACPAFAQIGARLGPFDLALLPIGLNRPRHFMSSVHANATDSMEIHRDINAKRSIGMHWGTVRGGISQYYEDVLDPPREWEDEARKAGKVWRDRKSKREGNVDKTSEGHANEDGTWEIGLLDVGESVIV